MSIKSGINEKGEICKKQSKIIDMYFNDKRLKEKVEKLLMNFDTGLIGFDIKKEKKDFNITGKHKIKEKEKNLEFIYESKGTKSLFFLLGNIINGIENNSVIIIDEFENGLHPEALNKLIAFVIDENEKNKAQIIFSSHSLGFINKLNMHQIYLTEKGYDQSSLVYRLNSVKGIRSDENFLNKYVSGAYGGLPRIRV